MCEKVAKVNADAGELTDQGAPKPYRKEEGQWCPKE